MPFDGTHETPTLRRARLIEALRAPMPDNFTWDFSDIRYHTDCGTAGCAIGLAMEIWPNDRRIIHDYPEKFFGITENEANRIFFSCGNYKFAMNDVRPEDVRPEMVADALEALVR